MVYEIAGPLFFGAANRAVEADVPAMDVTGLVALESAIRTVSKRKLRAILAENQPQPLEVLTKGCFFDQFPGIATCPSLNEAIATAKKLVSNI